MAEPEVTNTDWAYTAGFVDGEPFLFSRPIRSVLIEIDVCSPTIPSVVIEIDVIGTPVEGKSLGGLDLRFETTGSFRSRAYAPDFINYRHH